MLGGILTTPPSLPRGDALTVLHLPLSSALWVNL